MGGQQSRGEAASASTTSASCAKSETTTRFYSTICGNGNAVTSRQLTNYFPAYSHPFVMSLFGLSQHSDAEIAQEDFVSIIDKIMSPRSTASLSQIYFEAFCKSDPLEENDIKQLLTSALHLFLVTCQVSPTLLPQDQEAIDLVTPRLQSAGSVEAGLGWIETNCPDLLMGMHHWLVAQITAENQAKTENAPEYILEDHNDALLSVGLWWLLCSSLPSIYTQPAAISAVAATGDSPHKRGGRCQPWTLLYSSREHGLSVNRLQHHTLGYKGPTVLLVGCEGGYLYAVALDTEWREGTLPWGGAGCVAIRIAPDYTILEDGGNMIVFNDKSRNIPRGLFLGRDPKRRVLTITEGLQTATHRGGTGHVTNAEVWGCASSDAKLAQTKQKKAELKDAERNAKVKLPGQWDDNPDRMLLGWGTARTDYADGIREDRK